MLPVVDGFHMWKYLNVRSEPLALGLPISVLVQHRHHPARSRCPRQTQNGPKADV